MKLTAAAGSARATRNLPCQLSFDDLGTPLGSVTFAVIDVETTGMKPPSAALTEVAAAMFRGGECLGTFQSMVDPGMPVPARITELTGITDSMVRGAPTPAQVATELASLVQDAVIVGHNVRFDLAFLNAALESRGAGRIRRPVVDTLALARRLLAGETTTFSLSALCSLLRLSHRPSHRSLDDVMATADLLHRLIELASAYGATAIGDLLELPRLANHPQARKLRLTTDLPRQPGVYWFYSRTRSVLYVGSATDIRARVRSYFSTDARPKVPELLARTESIGNVTCRGVLEARVVELRLIQALSPPYNRRGRPTGRGAYLVVPRTRPQHARICRRRSSLLDEPEPEEAWIGPFPSLSSAEIVLGLLTDAGAAPFVWPALAGEEEQLVSALASRMTHLAHEERFEDAELVREGAETLLRLVRQRLVASCLAEAGRLLLGAGDEAVELDGGLLVTPLEHGAHGLPVPPVRPPEPLLAKGPVAPHAAHEVALVAAWMAANHNRLEVVRSERPLVLPALGSNPFSIRRRQGARPWNLAPTILEGHGVPRQQVP